MLENSWNTSFRIMYNLPYSTHRFFVQPVSGKTHIKRVLLERFLGFLTQIRNSRKKLPSKLLQSERKHHNILNSRSEYNRCSLPRLSTKMGEDSYKEFGQEIENEKNEELRIEKKIRELRKEKNKARLHPTKEVGPKRRKINEENN